MSYVVLDIETTGLNVVQGAIVEIGAVKVLSNGKTETFTTLVKPRVPIEPDAFAAHGITDEEAHTNGQEPAVALRGLLKFIGKLPVVAHNGFGFDFPFLLNEFKKAGFDTPENRLFDTMILVDKILDYDGSRSLASLCDAFKIINDQAHRALSDAQATNQIMAIILKAERDFDYLWEETSSLLWSDLLNLPPGFELLDSAIPEGKDVQMNYHGEQKPASVRWIKPLHFCAGRGGYLSVWAHCYRENKPKQFRLDRIKELLQAGDYASTLAG